MFPIDESLVIVAGRLSLDFVNTKCARLGTPLELIGDVEALNEWLALAGRAYGGDWSGDARTHARALELRAALWDLFEGVRTGRLPSPASMEAVNAVLESNPTYWRLEPGFRPVEVVAGNREEWLVAIAKDAVDLLSHGDFSLLRQCECATCVRLFYDTTKNHRRRWCVEKCGNRVKAAHYRRKRAQIESPDPAR